MNELRGRRIFRPCGGSNSSDLANRVERAPALDKAAGPPTIVLLIFISLIALSCSSPASTMPTTQPPTPTTAKASAQIASATTIPSRPQQISTITPQQLKELLDRPDKPPVFDARPKLSYDEGHLPGAISLPLTELEKRMSEVPKDRIVVFYCSGST